jgi:ABC-type protease/lipase transport system fused ATPase/permease subunit
MLTVITLIAVICGVLLEVIRRRMFMAWGNWIESLLGPKLFKAGLRSESGKVSSASALRDLATIKSFISGAAIIAWMDVIWAPLFITVVFLVAPQLGYIVLAACFIALVLGTVNEVATRDSRNATLKANKANSEWLSITERDPEAAGSLNQLNGLAGLWKRDANERSREGMRTRAVSLNFNAALQLIGRLVRIGVFGVGIWLVIENKLSIGAVIAANVLGRMAYSQVSSVMVKWRDLVRAIRAYGQIKTILKKDRTRRVSLPAKSTRPSLVLEDVSYRYSEQATSIFRRIHVSVHPGELLCLLGPSASGKSTFCRLASGIIQVRSGKILYGDVDVYHLQQNSPEREIGYLPQEYTLFQGSVRENIAGVPDNDMKLVVRAAKLAGIHETIIKFPQGYDTEIIDKEPHLSVGQRKAIAIARTFYGLPSLVVMDEPFAQLDADLQQALVRGLAKLRKNGGTIVISTQLLSFARFADNVLVFQDGKHFLHNRDTDIGELRKQLSSSYNKDNTKGKYRRGRSVSRLKTLRTL